MKNEFIHAFIIYMYNIIYKYEPVCERGRRGRGEEGGGGKKGEGKRGAGGTGNIFDQSLYIVFCTFGAHPT